MNGSRQQKLNLQKGLEDTPCKNLSINPNHIMGRHPNEMDTGTTCTLMTEPYPWMWTHQYTPMSDAPIQKKTSDAFKPKEDASIAKNKDMWHEIAPKRSTSNLLPHIDNDLPVIDRNLSNLAPDRRLRSKGNHSTHRNLAKVSESLTNPRSSPSLREHESLT